MRPYELTYEFIYETEYGTYGSFECRATSLYEARKAFEKAEPINSAAEIDYNVY